MKKDEKQKGLSFQQRCVKRAFDIFVSGCGLLCLGWLIVLAFFLACIDTRENGFFLQKRVGYQGQLFYTIKIRTMRTIPSITTVVTTTRDPRITKIGAFFRKTKIDELPQLINVLLGYMSLVGPRPDVPGFADMLSGEEKIILTVRPGITGPATLKYRNEEEILAHQKFPEEYNRNVIFPDKVRINGAYVREWSFWKDIQYIVHTVFR